MKRTLAPLRTLTAIPLLATFLGGAFAQSPGPQPQPVSSAATVSAAPLSFELADVHRSTRRNATAMSGNFLDGDRYIIHHATIAELVAKAYGVPSRKVQGGPFWIMNDRYDIIAKTQSDTPDDAIKQMLRNLLTDRFKLVIHTEDRPLPAYLITAPNGSSKMKPSDGSGTPGCKSQQAPDSTPPPGEPVAFSCHAESMTAFVDFLSSIMWNHTQPKIDVTGLKGLWDFDFKVKYPARTSVDSVNNFKAIENSIGLRVEAGKAPQSVLIVDSANETPTPNPPGVALLLPPLPPADFAVATIKPSSSDTEEVTGHIGGGQIDLTGVTMQFLINFALDLNDQMIADPPQWLDRDKFNILAKVAPSASATAAPFDDEDLPQMMKKLLEERFALKWHMEDRPADAYVLLAVNPKMKKADPLYHSGCQEGPGPDGIDPRIDTPIRGRLISCQNVTMEQFAAQLPLRSTGYIKIPMFDETRLTGAYDFVLNFSGYSQVGGVNEWSLTPPPPGGPAAVHLVVPPGGLLLFDAIEQQLGLKLEKQKRPLPTLVIDHIEEVPKGN